jgi:hypothetical protein
VEGLELPLVAGDAVAQRLLLGLRSCGVSGKLLIKLSATRGDACLGLGPDPLGFSRCPIADAGDVSLGACAKLLAAALGIGVQAGDLLFGVRAEIGDAGLPGLIGDLAHGGDEVAHEVVTTVRGIGGLDLRSGGRCRLDCGAFAGSGLGLGLGHRLWFCAGLRLGCCLRISGRRSFGGNRRIRWRWCIRGSCGRRLRFGGARAQFGRCHRSRFRAGLDGRRRGLALGSVRLGRPREAESRATLVGGHDARNLSF